jgi:hypothetical protein
MNGRKYKNKLDAKFKGLLMKYAGLFTCYFIMISPSGVVIFYNSLFKGYKGYAV